MLTNRLIQAAASRLPNNIISSLYWLFWFDFTNTSLLTLDGSNKCSSVVDRFGIKSLSQVGASSLQPTYSANLLNGKGGLIFNGAANYLMFPSGTDYSGLSAREFFAVVQAGNNSANKVIIQQWGSPSSYSFLFDASERLISNSWNTNGGGTNSQNTGTGLTSAIIANNYYDLAGENQGVAYNNNAFVTGTVTNLPVNPNSTPPYVGAFNTGAGYFLGNMFELIGFSKKLTNSERLAIRIYLSQKYKIAL